MHITEELLELGEAQASQTRLDVDGDLARPDPCMPAPKKSRPVSYDNAAVQKPTRRSKCWTWDARARSRGSTCTTRVAR